MSRLERGSNSRPFTGEEHCSIERPVDARRTSQGVGYSFASVWGAHTADSTQYDLLKENAQANRKNPTEAESILWDMLKGNNIGLHFRRQHIILDYIVDFICLDKDLVIELDGGYHNDPDQAKYDKQRTDHLKQLGYTELRFANEELLTNPDAVIAQIKEVAFSLPSLQGRAGERHLLPSLQGRGGDRLLLRGVCVGYVTVERNPIKQYFTRRAIIIGGPCLADDCTDEEVNALLCALKSTLLSGRDGVGSPIYIETRNFNDYSRWKGAFEKAGFEYKRHLNFHVDCTDKEKMWERLSENRKRQVRHVNGDFKFKISNLRFDNLPVTEQDVREWYAILSELYRKKVKTPLWPVEFFIEAYRQGIGQFMLVRHEGKIIGGSMVVRWKPTPNPSLKGGESSAHAPSQMSGLVRGSNSRPFTEGQGIGYSFASVWGAHTADTTQYSILKENAQANRKNPTEAETILWNLLKGNNLGLHFRRQHIILDYIVDFICLEKGLVIELDGGYHKDPDQAKYDKQRTDHLKQLGYTELRFANEELLTNPDAVIAQIKEVAFSLPSLQGRAGERHLLPSFQGRAGDRLGTVYEWFECGLNAQYKEQYPSVMATYAGMCYAAEQGIGRYDMMGAGVPDVPYGVRDFKAEFGGQLVEHGRFVCVRKLILYKIGTMAVKMMKGT